MAPRRVKPSLYISVDIEADGPIPGPYSMLSLGAAVAGVQDVQGFFGAAISDDAPAAIPPPADDWFADARF